MKKSSKKPTKRRSKRGKTRRCRHTQPSGIVWNPTDGDKLISVLWCWRCGAVKRSIGIPDGAGSFVYTWCGGLPEWETSHGINGVIRDKNGTIKESP